MKQLVRTLALVFGVLGIMTSHAAAQTAGIQSDALKDWTGLKDTMMKIAAAMPDDKFGFKSTPAQRSYGEQVLHVAQVNIFVLKTLGAKAAAPEVNMRATSKADVIKAMADTFDYGTAAIKELNDQAMLATVQGPQFLGASTRARIVYFTIGHTWDIYGQMAVYLRLSGVVPPASQRP